MDVNGKSSVCSSPMLVQTRSNLTLSKTLWLFLTHCDNVKLNMMMLLNELQQNNQAANRCLLLVLNKDCLVNECWNNNWQLQVASAGLSPRGRRLLMTPLSTTFIPDSTLNADIHCPLWTLSYEYFVFFFHITSRRWRSGDSLVLMLFSLASVGTSFSGPVLPNALLYTLQTRPVWTGSLPSLHCCSFSHSPYTAMTFSVPDQSFAGAQSPIK